MKQKIEIEVDVPEGMEIKCQGSRNDLRPVITPTECTSQIMCNVILRPREPVRESRWTVWHGSPWGYRTIAEAQKFFGPGAVMERRDYIDGKQVRVELEEVSDG